MPSHTTRFVRAIALACAFSLIIASAGFGAVFAWTATSGHSHALAILTVLFAIALEGIKPLAIAASIAAFHSWALVRGLALLLLGVVAIAYSLTAEIAVVAGSRGDLAAQRQNEGDSSDAAKTKYEQAIAELKIIMPSRLVPEVEAEILRTTDPRRIAKLRGEIARTKQREKLQAIVANYRPGVRLQADPGASAIATYLAAAGYTISVPTLSQWLSLVPVLALELGSALAMVLVQAISVKEPLPSESQGSKLARTTHFEIDRPQLRPFVPLLPPPSAYRDDVAELILDHLRRHGNHRRTTERALARTIGADRSTMRRAMLELASTGAIAVEATKRGTLLKLI